jgi:tetratricopeptide (TPR) repeat protein
MDEGKFDRAVEQFKRGFHLLPPNHAPQIAYGIALLKVGQQDEAIEELERVCRWVPISDIMIGMQFLPEKFEWPMAAVKAHYWLGVAYEQQGRKVDAAKEYRTFLDTWKNADFPSPEIKDAKARLARLS